MLTVLLLVMYIAFDIAVFLGYYILIPSFAALQRVMADILDVNIMTFHVHHSTWHIPNAFSDSDRIPRRAMAICIYEKGDKEKRLALALSVSVHSTQIRYARAHSPTYILTFFPRSILDSSP